MAHYVEKSKKNNAPHVIVIARAGTGKTTTLVEGLRRIKGMPCDITPSPQQAAVWEAMAASKDADTIAFVAFNKSIAEELQVRVPESCEAMTMHSMGFRAVTKALGRQQPNKYVVQDAIAAIEEKDIRELRKHKLEAIKAAEKLVSLSKMNLLGWDGEVFDPYAIDDQELYRLAAEYDVDLNHPVRDVFRWTRECLDRATSPQGKIAFDDMIFLPIVLGLPVFKFDLLLVDEAQDLNRCQQQLALRAGSRLILCGDPKQAIYGFAGADSCSMDRMEETLSDTPAGVITLPLTVTRRCGKAIVEEASRLVPDFEAHEGNPEGLISESRMDDPSYRALVEDGDMILCRVNAPLVSQCFKFIKAGRRANIQGRDVGTGLISTIKKMDAASVVDLTSKLSDWLHVETQRESARKNPHEHRLIALQDRYDCLQCFIEGTKVVEDVIAKIESVFTDDRDGSVGIKLSSIHKAKGLESRRVFFLEPKGAGCPHPMARTKSAKDQEMNLRYVAITRARDFLCYVTEESN